MIVTFDQTINPKATYSYYSKYKNSKALLIFQKQ